MAVNAVLAARADAQAQGSGTAQQGRPVMPYQGAGDAAASRKGAGEGEISKTGTSSLFAQFGVEPEKVADPLSDRSAGRSLLLDEAAGSLKVLRQETHFAPNMRLSPAQQVGDQVTTALSELTAGKTSLSEGISTKAEGPVLKTLDIQLTPHELGTVKVSLKIVGDTVEVSMVASNAQTAELLKQDKQMLDQMLRATGFKADTVTVQAADDRTAVQQTSQAGTSGSATSQNGAGQSAAGDGSAQNFNGSGSGQQNGRAGQNGPEEVFRNSDTTKGKGHEESTGVSLSDGIYL
ncbi:flagellar hook-length control protein FliK [Roseibium aggregatum]|uniref:Flagellar hook-length control protein FliK n=1 Tax=Roseibium aggregatum TaxID=187304 RepID=A0A939ECK2_9HYPH|nr:flagellar hook-length control protein FliK [Roseibium aggregatum]MBN9670727.1 flagellar hook-length control protein FliK [Roseibium aggregatum]